MAVTQTQISLLLVAAPPYHHRQQHLPPNHRVDYGGNRWGEMPEQVGEVKDHDWQEAGQPEHAHEAKGDDNSGRGRSDDVSHAVVEDRAHAAHENDQKLSGMLAEALVKVPGM